ncbi:hypothetical protein [Alteribacter aurantiacus]|uniref:hypothetical protein n=1 Tax=Alteribacter aurantiacus TaxID=254410 RepID=UPI000402E0B5|nr:hypothetical protein [Alteribacter aurantiacus]
MKEMIKERLMKAFHLTEDFYLNLTNEQLSLSISTVPSNTIGEQAYCLIGARESYLNALFKGEWDGFTCSLSSATNSDEIISKLTDSRDQIEHFLQQETLTQTQINIVFDLLEHEVQHHGQLIRFGYANKLEFPTSWNERYTV